MTEAAQILDKASTTGQAQTPNLGAAGTQQPPTEQKQEDPKVASKLQMLIQREQAAMAREKAAKDYEEKSSDKIKKAEAFEEFKQKKDAKRALELLGMSWDELQQQMMNSENPDDPIHKIKSIDEKFNKYIESQEAEKKRLAEEQKVKAEAQEKQTIENYKGEIKTFVKDNSAKYELINFEGCDELVYELIDENYRRTMDETTGIGKVLSIAEASDLVEKHLEEKYDRAKQVSKVKNLWNAMPKGLMQNMAAKQFQQQPKKPTTLTNTLTATQTKPRTTPLSDDERVRRAIEFAKSLRPNIS